MKQFRTKHIFILTTLIAVIIAFAVPILLRGRQTVHQQLCEDLGIDQPDKTQIIAYSAFADASREYHSYFLLQTESEGKHVLRHAFHTPRKLWWLQNWYPINASTLKTLGLEDIQIEGERTFSSEPKSTDIEAFLATMKPVLRNAPVTTTK